MKNHILDITITAETLTAMSGAATTLSTEVVNLQSSTWMTPSGSTR